MPPLLGVLMISGDVWKEMRRFSIRTLRDFGFGKQKSMESSIQEELGVLTECLLQEMAAGDGIVKMKQFFTVFVLNNLWSMITGVRFSHEDAKLRDLLVLIDKEIKSNAIGSVGGPMYLYSAFPILGKIMPPFSRQEIERKILMDKMQQFFRVSKTIFA
jgi:methyl farnesoate epoxidase/farnesoate epoxidase